MGEKEWLLLGVLIGIPIGMMLLWLFTRNLSAHKSFSNLEEWEFIRDPVTGRTKGLRVKRRAEAA